MTYQYKREPLTQDEANSLANACQTHEERLVVWTLLDTGLRVSEHASLNKNNIDWQNHRLIMARGALWQKDQAPHSAYKPASPPNSRRPFCFTQHPWYEQEDYPAPSQEYGQQGPYQSAYNAAFAKAHLFSYSHSKGNLNQIPARSFRLQPSCHH